MSFTPGIPATGQKLGASRTQVLNNFATLRTAIEVNHVDINVANAGKHKFIQMPVRATIPAGLAASEGNIYSKTISAASELFYSPGASGNEYQLTRTIGASFARFGTNTGYLADHTGGWTFLPGGLIMQYGLRSSPGSSGIITFPVAFTNIPYQITVSLYRANANEQMVIDSGTVPTTTTFNYLCSSAGSVGVYWTAIGK